MKSLYKFNTTADYNNAAENLPYINVSYVAETDTINYNDNSSEIETDPFTIKILELESGQDYCTIRLEPKPREEQPECYYKINDGQWQYRVIKTYNEQMFTGLRVNDTLQIICNASHGLMINGVWYDGQWGSFMSYASIKVSGNYMSTVCGYDYLQNSVGPDTVWEDDSVLGRLCGEGQGYIKDVSELWLPDRGKCTGLYNHFFKELGEIQTYSLTYEPDTAYQNLYCEMFMGCNNLTGTATIGTNKYEYNAFGSMFYSTGITRLNITKTDVDIMEQIAPYCQNLTTIYNYTNHYIQIAANKDDMASEGTLYYVDYGAEMAYNPAEMVPSGWTCTAIQPNTPNE